MAIHRKRKHRTQQQTAAQITSTTQQSAVQGLMMSRLAPEEPMDETDSSTFSYSKMINNGKKSKSIIVFCIFFKYCLTTLVFQIKDMVKSHIAILCSPYTKSLMSSK